MATATLSQPSAGTRAITIDAIFCAISGSSLVLFNGALSDATGIPALVLLVVGLATVAAAAVFMAVMMRLPEMMGFLLRAALAVNVAWVIASVVALLSGVWTLTGTGVALIIGIALIVEAISIGQWRALK
jgi:uncharacterized membrane protein